MASVAKIGQNLETYYAEYNRLPDVANLTKAMGLSVCKKIQNPSKNCIKLKALILVVDINFGLSQPRTA